MKPSEQGLFLQDSKNEYNKFYAMIKLEQKLRYLSGFSTNRKIILPVMVTSHLFLFCQTTHFQLLKHLFKRDKYC